MHANPADLILCVAMWMLPYAGVGLAWMADKRRGPQPPVDQSNSDEAP